MSLLDRARPELLGLAGYSSARMEASGGRVLLNANESPWDVVSIETGSLNRYPDPQPAALCARLGALYGVPAANLLVGRGSDEAIDLLTRAFCRAGEDEVIVAPPTFGMYAVCAAVQGARVASVPLAADAGFAYPFDAVAARAGERTKLVYVCSPNNPTGNAIPREAILDLAARLAGRALLVVDEAYVEFADAESLAPEAARIPNLAVLRTLSKAHALAGARVGCLVADAKIVALLRRIIAPYPLPSPSIRAAEAALSNHALQQTSERVEKTRVERERLRAALANLPGVRAVLPSQANFLAARFDDARGTYERLLARGIVVRDLGRYPGLEGFLRVTIGREVENEAVLEAIGAEARVR